MRKHKKIMAMAFAFFFAMLAAANVQAEEFASRKTGLDIVFVMDYSGSMKANDPGYIAKGMVKAFVDTVHSADIRIGFVAYNDRLLSSASVAPVYTNEERQELKELIDKDEYSGNTDIGMGLRYAYELIGQGEERDRAIVLISDGESDLTGSTTGRQLEDALQDIEYATAGCEDEGIPIYSIAFGEYDGNTELLEQASLRTGGQMYSVHRPEDLIEILYGIFTDSMAYDIEKIADGTYAAGTQDILLKLDELYIDELDVLLISPQDIGRVEVSYGKQHTEAVNLKNYAVAKITEIDIQEKELVVRTETTRNQELQVYLIAYRDLTPILNVETSVGKNRPLEYQVYFKDKNGNAISDEAFYQNFSYEFVLRKDGEAGKPLNTDIRNGIACGEVVLESSGTYFLEGRLEDHMGKAGFMPVDVTVQNKSPEGSLPEDMECNVLSGEQRISLDAYFSDPDGDEISYSLKDNGGAYAKAEIQSRDLVLNPVKAGEQTVTVLVSDGEETCEYFCTLEIIPLWRAYWWCVVILVLFAVAVLAIVAWKIVHKPVSDIEKLDAETKRNHFSGKLDAYFTLQPEAEDEIPPLSFQMHKIKENMIHLGELMQRYPEVCSSLGLDQIILTADENRRMVLYHTSNASVMIGNSIVCRQIQYSISFGDVIYITSEDGAYDLEIHYVSVIQ
nr:vWA domain-containing protein [uncultured Acetatifactor sp.]